MIASPSVTKGMEVFGKSIFKFSIPDIVGNEIPSFPTKPDKLINTGWSDRFSIWKLFEEIDLCWLSAVE